MPKDRQVSFAAGELHPNLHGRTDLDRYRIGARTVKNFVVTPEGMLAKRTGTKHVAELHRSIFYAGLSTANLGVIRPLIFSDDDAVMLLFTDETLHVVEDPTNTRHGVASLDVNTSQYPSSVLRRMRIRQIGNVAIVVSGSHAPAKIERDSNGNISRPVPIDFSLIDFPYPSLDNPGGVTPYNGPMLRTAPWRKADGSVEEYVGLPAGLLRNEFESPNPDVNPWNGDADHPPIVWEWAVTYVVQDQDTGDVFETAHKVIDKQRMDSYTIVYDDDFRITSSVISVGAAQPIKEATAVYPDWPQSIIHEYDAAGVLGRNLIVWADLNNRVYRLRFIAMRVYRGIDGYLGYIGETSGIKFVDRGFEPDYTTPPPNSETLFDTYSGGVLQGTEDPRAAVHHEDRLFFVGTDERPNVMIVSAVGDYFDFSNKRFPKGSDPFAVQANAGGSACDVISTQYGLLVFTTDGEILVSGSSSGEAITAGSVSARVLSRHGTSRDVRVERMGEWLAHVGPNGVGPVALLLSDRGVQSKDLAVQSGHFFGSETIVDWAWAKDPHRVLWVVMSNGTLLSMTFVPDEGLLAWAQHDIDGGFVESVGVKPGTRESDVYLVVKRGTDRFLEKFAYYNFEDIRDCVYLDRAVTWDGKEYNTGNGYDFIVTDPGGGGAIGTDVTVTFHADEATVDPVGKVGHYIHIDADSDDEDDDRPYLLYVHTSAGGGGYTAQVMEERAFDKFGDTISNWYEARESVTGLDHLEGEEVVAVADGNVVTGLTVDGGGVNIGSLASVIHVGKRITSQFESLDISQDRDEEKIVSEALIELERSRGGKIGSSLDETLEDIQTRGSDEGYLASPPTRDDFEMRFEDTWDRRGRVAVEHDDPTPFTILGITRKYELGG